MPGYDDNDYELDRTPRDDEGGEDLPEAPLSGGEDEEAPREIPAVPLGEPQAPYLEPDLAAEEDRAKSEEPEPAYSAPSSAEQPRQDLLAPLTEEEMAGEEEEIRIVTLEDRRQGETLIALGAFMAILAIPVLIGTAFAGSSVAQIVNAVAGGILLLIGIGFLLRGRLLLKRLIG